jgi:hypothetical protein
MQKFIILRLNCIICTVFLQKDDTMSGKVLELLCLLKRKDNRTYTRFIQVLEERGCLNVFHLLTNKGVPPGGSDEFNYIFLHNK